MKTKAIKPTVDLDKLILELETERKRRFDLIKNGGSYEETQAFTNWALITNREIKRLKTQKRKS